MSIRKSNNYYLEIIEKENSKVFGVDYKALKNAKRTLKRRTIEAYKNGLITFEECLNVTRWLRNTRG